MIEKKGKAYKSSLSKAGKDSAIHAFLKLSGYKIMSPKNPKKKRKFNLFLDDLDHLKDNLIIVKNYETSIDESMKKQLEFEKQLKKPKNPKNKIKLNFFHTIQNNETELKNEDMPPCTKYTPKYEIIYPKVIIGPEWKYVSGRKYKKIEPDLKDFIITHDSIIDNEKKTLVNMNMDTQRGSFFGIKDLRIRTDKKFDYKLNLKIRKKLAQMIKKKQEENQKENKNENDNKKNIGNSLKLAFSFSDNFNTNEKNKKEKNKISNKVYKENLIDKNITNTKSKNNETPSKKSLSKNKNNISVSNSKEKNDENDTYQKSHIKTINFDKILSREMREKAFAKKKLVDIIRNPDHSPLYERTKIFKYYTINTHSSILKKFPGFNSYFNYDPNKAYKIRIVHPLDKVPNFNLILPRPEEDKNLPTFMQKMFNRNNVYTINDKGLKLNEYSKQNLGHTMTSFFPKKSFNNIVNLNFITGNIFENDYKIDEINTKKNEIKQRIRNKNKNLGKLIKEGGLKRFDNFSYRTFYKSKNIMIGDLNKYLLGLKES